MVSYFNHKFRFDLVIDNSFNFSCPLLLSADSFAVLIRPTRSYKTVSAAFELVGAFFNQGTFFRASLGVSAVMLPLASRAIGIGQGK